MSKLTQKRPKNKANLVYPRLPVPPTCDGGAKNKANLVEPRRVGRARLEVITSMPESIPRPKSWPAGPLVPRDWHLLVIDFVTTGFDNGVVPGMAGGCRQWVAGGGPKRPRRVRKPRGHDGPGRVPFCLPAHPRARLNGHNHAAHRESL